MNLLEHFVCGGFGGVASVFVGHPLDTVKVRLQTMPVVGKGERPLYSGTWDCMTKIFKNEGLAGFYKGVGAPLIGIAPMYATSFFGYGLFRELLDNQFMYSDFDSTRRAHVTCFVAGALSAIFTTVFTVPGERVKCILQIQPHSKVKQQYSGTVDCATQLYRRGGLANLYKGFYVTLLRDVPAFGIYFLTYQSLRELLTDETSLKSNYMAAMIAGGMAGIGGCIVGLPMDVVKSRIQSAPEGTYPNRLRDVIATLYKQEGTVALYRGMVPVLLKAFPSSAACFAIVELCKECKYPLLEGVKF